MPDRRLPEPSAPDDASKSPQMKKLAISAAMINARAAPKQ
jgi:hypothetical protein